MKSVAADGSTICTSFHRWSKHDKVPCLKAQARMRTHFFCLPVRCFSHWTEPVSKCWLAKACMKNSLFIFTPCMPPLPSRLLRSNKGNSLSLGSRPSQLQGHFTLVLLSLWNSLPLSIHSAIPVATFKKHLKTHLFELVLSPQTLTCPMAC